MIDLLDILSRLPAGVRLEFGRHEDTTPIALMTVPGWCPALVFKRANGQVIAQVASVVPYDEITSLDLEIEALLFELRRKCDRLGEDLETPETKKGSRYEE